MDQRSEFFKNEKQFFFLSHEVEYSFFPVIVGYERCSAEKEVINTRNKIYYLLHFVINGSGILSINNKSYTIEKP